MKKSKIPLPYDVWIHLQIAIDPKTHTCKIVEQPAGEVAHLVATADLSNSFKEGEAVSVRFLVGGTAKPVAMDNIQIAEARR